MSSAAAVPVDYSCSTTDVVMTPAVVQPRPNAVVTASRSAFQQLSQTSQVAPQNRQPVSERRVENEPFNNGSFSGIVKGHELVSGVWRKGNIIYGGQFSNGLFNGRGVYTALEADLKISFEGLFVNNKFCTGEAENIRHAGGLYSGHMENGCLHGKGVYTRSEADLKSSFEGTFEKGEFCTGEAVNMRNEGGGVYTGHLENGRFNGQGVYKKGNMEVKGIFENGKLKEGDVPTSPPSLRRVEKELFNNGAFTGTINANYREGIWEGPSVVYRGQFFNDLIHGRGIYIYSEGDLKSSYEGIFQNGQFYTGVVENMRHEGGLYSGHMENGRLNGGGIFKKGNLVSRGIFVNGSLKEGEVENMPCVAANHQGVYTGPVVNFVPKGSGVFAHVKDNYTLSYEGEFDGGILNGRGTYKYAINNGPTCILKGVFQNGNFRSGYVENDLTCPSEPGALFTGTYENGERHGVGRLVWNNGSVLEGKWTNGKRDSLFICRDKGGKNLYRETWKDGVLIKDRIEHEADDFMNSVLA